MTKPDMRTPDFTNENIAQIAALFPNCVTEAKDEKGRVKKAIDFDLLKQELSANIVDGTKERYTLNWPGKKEALAKANEPINKTLRPCEEESVNFDTTQNLYIEGDNLEALKLLQESYLGKIKMIYIDPPYNTGKDFVYKDNFTGDKDDELEASGQKDEEGGRLVANLESNGRYHSDWLTMIYPRLKLARNLLKDDGVIFISIDDNEVSNLQKLCDEIFGEDNLVADLIWTNSEGGGGSDSSFFRVKHEHILCYCKNISNVEIFGTEISNRERYTQSDEYENTRGPYYLQKLGMGSIQYSESLDYPIEAPDKSLVMPKDNNSGKKACWRWSKTKYDWGIDNGFIEIKKDSKNIWTVYTKQYLNSDNEGNFIKRTQRPFGVIDKFSSTQASKFLDSIELKFFDYSKPHQLIEYLIERVAKGNDIVLDFFSGSATTAHSVLKINSEDDANRKYICVQLPEKTDEKSEAYKAGYKNICEIGKERIRRASKKILEENKDKEGIENLDIGFRVLKVDSSNMKDVYYNPDEINQLNLFDTVDNIKDGRSAEDLLFQVLLDWGVDLMLPIRSKELAGHKVFFVDDDALAACFEENLDEEFITELAKKQILRVVFKDSGFANDDIRINVEQIFKQYSPDTEVKVI